MRRVSSSRRTGVTTENVVSHTASETCSRSAAAHAVHSWSARSTCTYAPDRRATFHSGVHTCGKTVTTPRPEPAARLAAPGGCRTVARVRCCRTCRAPSSVAASRCRACRFVATSRSHRNRCRLSIDRRPTKEARWSRRHPREAHIPAQQPTSCQEARLPSPHGHRRGPQRRAEPSAQGPRPPLGLIWRIRDRRTFVDLRRRGRRARHGSVSVTYLPATATTVVEPPRIAFAVPRKVGTAVVRNRLRRQVQGPSGLGSPSTRPDWRPAPTSSRIRPGAGEHRPRPAPRRRRSVPRPALGRVPMTAPCAHERPRSLAGRAVHAVDPRLSMGVRRAGLPVPVRSQLLQLRPRGARGPRLRQGLVALDPTPRPLSPLGWPRLGPRSSAEGRLTHVRARQLAVRPVLQAVRDDPRLLLRASRRTTPSPSSC